MRLKLSVRRYASSEETKCVDLSRFGMRQRLPVHVPDDSAAGPRWGPRSCSAPGDLWPAPRDNRFCASTWDYRNAGCATPRGTRPFEGPLSARHQARRLEDVPGHFCPLLPPVFRSPPRSWKKCWISRAEQRSLFYSILFSNNLDNP